jgi:acetyl-CoA synthetase
MVCGCKPASFFCSFLSLIMISFVYIFTHRRCVASIHACGYKPGDRLALCMPMTVESVVIYLSIVLSGCVVVSIAESFAAEEIATRLKIAGAAGCFTQEAIMRGGRALPLYSRMLQVRYNYAFIVFLL